MDEKHRSLLTQQRPKLVQNLHNMEGLCDYLQSVNILSEEMVQNISAERTDRAKARKLLDDLPRRGPTAFEMFICGLKECDMDYIAEDLVKQLNESQSVVPPTGGQTHLSTNRQYGGYQRCPSSERYRMESTPRGYCLIINNIDFNDPQKNREGAKQDQVMLEKIFTQLGFQVDIQNDLSAAKMLLSIKEFSELEYHGEVDSCVLAISTHGKDKDVVYGSDSEEVSLIDIYRLFDNGSCENLCGKPKLFLIQACRGMPSSGNSNSSLAPQCSTDNTPCLDGSIECVSQATHDKADKIIARATTEGDPAHRNINNGSWFIQAVVKVLQDDSREEEVSQMLTKANRIVAEWKTGAAGVVINDSHSLQISEYTATLTRKWYLNPLCPGL